MTTKEIKISYQEFDNIDDLETRDKALVEAAMEAMKNSYAPYSNFNVGAALRLEDDTIVIGANQENAAYPSGLCAERTALFYAGAKYPDLGITTLALCAGQNGVVCDNPATPCGACRQVMAQYQRKLGRPMQIIMVGAKKTWKFSSVDDILPLTFDSI